MHDSNLNLPGSESMKENNNLSFDPNYKPILMINKFKNTWEFHDKKRQHTQSFSAKVNEMRGNMAKQLRPGM